MKTSKHKIRLRRNEDINSNTKPDRNSLHQKILEIGDNDGHNKRE